VRPSRQIFLAIATIFIAVALVPALVPVLVPALFPAVSGPPPAPPPDDTQELIVMVRPGPVVYYPAPDGSIIGFDVELLRRFAAQRGTPLRFVPVDSGARMQSAVARGEAHIGVGGLLRPPAPPKPRVETPLPAVPDPVIDPAASVLWTSGFYTVEPVLIYNSDSYKPANWRDLKGETVAYIEGTGLDPDIAKIATEHPGIHFRALDLPSPAGLFAQVSEGSASYALVGSLQAAVARNVYLDYDVAFTAGAKRELAWIVSPRFRSLVDELDLFLQQAKRDGTVRRLAERYVPEQTSVARIDASALAESIRGVLPRWRAMFHDAQERTEVEWRLLAAIAYQESKWDPYAESETGVRGFMQITEDTAKHLGITNLLDPAQNVLGAARYLRDLKAKLPPRIAEPDRTWLALAAFNIGIAHVEDARVLAQKQKLNPDSWSDVRKALPLLALSEYHADAKYGYARGGMPVAFVDRVRAYYDVLLAREAALAPRLRMAGEPETPSVELASGFSIRVLSSGPPVQPGRAVSAMPRPEPMPSLATIPLVEPSPALATPWAEAMPALGSQPSFEAMPTLATTPPPEPMPALATAPFPPPMPAVDATPGTQPAAPIDSESAR